MAKFIKFRDRYINIDKVRYIEQFNDYEDIYDIRTRKDERIYFNTFLLHFTEKEFIRLRNVTIEELESLIIQ